MPNNPFPERQSLSSANPFPERGANPFPERKEKPGVLSRTGTRASEAFKGAIGERIGLDDPAGFQRDLMQKGMFGPFAGITTGVAQLGATALEPVEGAIRAGLGAGAELGGTLVNELTGDQRNIDVLEGELNLGFDLAAMALGAKPTAPRLPRAAPALARRVPRVKEAAQQEVISEPLPGRALTLDQQRRKVEIEGRLEGPVAAETAVPAAKPIPRPVSDEAVGQIKEGITGNGLPSEIGALTDETRLAREAQLPPKPELTGRAKWADRVINSIEKAGAEKLSPLGSVPAKESYLALRYRTMGKIAKVEEISKGIQTLFAKGSKADNVAAYEYLTTKGATADLIQNPALRAKAAEVKETIDLVGQELVRRGKLSQEVFDANRGEYLPRIYLKHLVDESPQLFSGGKIKQTNLDYLKPRSDIPKELRELMGEIEDPGFLAARGVALPVRDIMVSDFLKEVARNRAWVNPASVVEWKGQPVSTKWLHEEANGLRRRASVTDDVNIRARMRQEADAADAAVKGAAETAGAELPNAYARVPDSPRYGDLAGLELRKELHNDIVGVMDPSIGMTGAVEKFFSGHGTLGKIHRGWKMSKTVGNVPTHFRNMSSNAVLLNLGGVPIHRVPIEVAGAARNLLGKGELINGHSPLQVAKDFGITEGTFNSQELIRFKKYLGPVEPRTGALGWMEKVAKVGASKAGQAANKAGDLYQAEEVLFKVAFIRDALRKGMSPVEAAMGAQKTLFDYSLVPRSVRYLRSNPVTGSPFITFAYKSAGVLADTAIRHPQRFLPYIALPFAMSAMAEMNNDVTDEDIETLRKDLPEWMENKGSLYMLPMKDKNGRWQFIDFGYMLPWGVHQQLMNSALGGDAQDVLQGTGLFGTPTTDIFTAIRTNIDPFTKREIVNEFDPPERQLTDTLNYIYRMAAPTFITDIGAVGKMMEAGGINRYGEPGLTEAQAGARLFGVNTYPIDQEASRDRLDARISWQIRQTEMRMRSVLRDQRLSPEDRQGLVSEYIAEIKKLQQEKQEIQSRPSIEGGR